MEIEITGWEVELTNENGDRITLNGEWYADFFKEYDSKQLIIADVVGQSEQLKCDCCSYKYSELILKPDGSQLCKDCS